MRGACIIYTSRLKWLVIKYKRPKILYSRGQYFLLAVQGLCPPKASHRFPVPLDEWCGTCWILPGDNHSGSMPDSTLCPGPMSAWLTRDQRFLFLLLCRPAESRGYTCAFAALGPCLLHQGACLVSSFSMVSLWLPGLLEKVKRRAALMHWQVIRRNKNLQKQFFCFRKKKASILPTCGWALSCYLYSKGLKSTRFLKK